MGAIGHALAVAGSMTWEILWALILGFALSAVVQAVVRKSTIVAARRRPAPYAGRRGRAGRRVVVVLLRRGCVGPLAVSQGRQLHRSHGVRDRLHQPRRGARHHPGPADGLAVHRRGVHRRPDHDRGAGGAVPAVRALPDGRRRPSAGRPWDRRLDGRPRRDGHVRARRGIVLAAARSRHGYTAVSHVFVMEWAAILRDLVLGLFIAGAIAAWVPESFWQNFFITDHPTLSVLWGPIIGPIVAIV